MITTVIVTLVMLFLIVVLCSLWAGMMAGMRKVKVPKLFQYGIGAISGAGCLLVLFAWGAILLQVAQERV